MFKPRLLIDQVDVEFVDRTHDWIIDWFGEKYLRTKQVIIPADFFRTGYSGKKKDILRLNRLLCTIMDINIDDIDFRYMVGDQAHRSLDGFVHGLVEGSGIGGTYSEINSNSVIHIDESIIPDPIAMVAVTAHELSHYKLISQNRITEDDEHLTDMLPTYYGLGLFTSGSVANVRNYNGPGTQGWSVRKLGYLSEYLHGYLLAKWVVFKKYNPKQFKKIMKPNVFQSFRNTLKVWGVW